MIWTGGRELRTFTQGEWDVMLLLGVEQRQQAGAKARFNSFRWDTQIEANAEGMMGEWSVADSLGLSRPIDISGKSDKGIDMRAGGLTLQVRSTGHQGGRLMSPLNRPVKADIAILTIRAAPLAMWIVGGVTREEYKARGRVTDFGYGRTRYLEQDELQPWAELRPQLVTQCQTCLPSPHDPSPRSPSGRPRPVPL